MADILNLIFYMLFALFELHAIFFCSWWFTFPAYKISRYYTLMICSLGSLT